MSKMPDNRRPYDPAKAARDRNNLEQSKAGSGLSAAQRQVRKPGLRPISPAAPMPDGDDEEM